MVCENADEHPALALEHCTLVSHVKAGDAKRIDFSMFCRGQAKAALRFQTYRRCVEQDAPHLGAKIG
jgi:hypothetical protein